MVLRMDSLSISKLARINCAYSGPTHLGYKRIVTFVASNVVKHK